MIIDLFNLICYQPLLNLLVFIYNVLPVKDLGIVIFILTILIRLALYPFSSQSIRAQKDLQELQPKIEEIKKKFKDQKEQQAAEMMKLYKEHKINPFSSCLPLLIQIPFLIAVYQVFRTGLSNGSLDLLYPFVANPGKINTLAFGFLDLARSNVILAVLAGAAQFFQTKMLMAKKPEVKAKGSQDENMASIMNKQMTIMMPLFTVIMGVSLPSGLVFYWLVLTLATLAQQYLVFRKRKKTPEQVPPATPSPVN